MNQHLIKYSEQYDKLYDVVKRICLLYKSRYRNRATEILLITPRHTIEFNTGEDLNRLKSYVNQYVKGNGYKAKSKTLKDKRILNEVYR
jgi:hypothetical protein